MTRSPRTRLVALTVIFLAVAIPAAAIANWRAGYTNIAAGGNYTAIWAKNLPVLGTLIGENVFTLVAEDVTFRDLTPTSDST